MMQVFARSLDPYDDQLQEKDAQPVQVTEKHSGESDVDSEGFPREDGLTEAPRKVVLIQAVLCAITIILIIAALGSGWRQIAIQIMVDHNWVRLAFILVMPLQIWLALVRSSFKSVKGVADEKYLRTVLYAVRCRFLRSANRPLKANA
jgi:hypothetical protein